MALLICLLTILPFSLTEGDLDTSPVAVLFDKTSPEDSIGVIKNQLVESGSVYQNYRVLMFDHDAIILETLESNHTVRLPVTGEVEERLRSKAVALFVVKQLRKIYQGQVKYFEKHGRYATDFDSLIQEGFTDSLFDEVREGYQFAFVKNEYQEGPGPQFRILASPVETEAPGPEPPLFFSLGALGLVRSGATPSEAHWGPAWDYSDHNDAAYEFIGVE